MSSPPPDAEVGLSTKAAPQTAAVPGTPNVTCEVLPATLRFDFELEKQLLRHITIRNMGTARLAYKIKTTNVKRYVVKPNAGECDPGQEASVQVILIAQKFYPVDLTMSKDRFLVQLLQLKDGESMKPEMFSETATVKPVEFRVKVKLSTEKMDKKGIKTMTALASLPPDAKAADKLEAAQQDIKTAENLNHMLENDVNDKVLERDNLQARIDLIEIQGGGQQSAPREFTVYHAGFMGVVGLLLGLLLG